MKSAPLADATLAIMAAPPECAAIAKTPTEPFGAVLDEATEERPAAPADEEKPDENETPVIPIVAYFCPPPRVEAIQLVSVQGVEAQGIAAEPDAEALLESSAPTESTEGGIQLDRKIFEPISTKLALTETSPVVPNKIVEAQGPAVTNASHGTLVAKLENRVKNTEKTAEFAPANQQKMPVREIWRRAVVETARVESFHAEQQPAHLLDAEFEIAPAEVIELKTLDTTKLVESIRTEVSSLRHRGEMNMTVVLRPDSGTQLSLDVSIGRDGTIHAQARCERGDFQMLNAQWPQLQQSLAAHGIRIADLSNQNNSQQHHHSAADQFQNFDRGQNSQQREQREVSKFEEQFASRNKIPLSKPQPQTASVAPAPRYWQSWA
jgi:hypothetical protein